MELYFPDAVGELKHQKAPATTLTVRDVSSAGCCELPPRFMYLREVGVYVVCVAKAMIQSAPRHQGHELVLARAGAEAVGLATDRQFDLVLLDLQMPVTDGFDACQTLRLNPRLNDVPIVLLTAHSHETKLRARRVPGVTDYLLKPFGVTRLRANVRDWLTRKSVHPDGSWEPAREPLSGPRSRLLEFES